MTTTHVQTIGGFVIASVLALFAFTGSVSAEPIFGNTALAGYGGQDKVTICHKDKNTITVAEPALKAHLKHGDVEGACVVE